MLFDDQDISGLTRAQVDEASARVYAWLSRKGIGKEDFVLVCMPRGIWSIVSMIGVWKAGAALTVVEDNYAKERISFIKKYCGCKAVIDLNAWQEINEENPKPGYEPMFLKGGSAPAISLSMKRSRRKRNIQLWRIML